LILEQFSELGEQCTWCGAFYSAVKDMMLSPDSSPDQKSYYAEVLAVSGKLDNIKTLVDATKNAGSAENADIYAEALELSILEDDAVSYLKEYLNADDEILKEAVIAAMTNQGSRLAAEILYQHTLEQGDPDGYYALGIGLGEIIPEEETFPLLQQIMDKRDDYSHLGVKALLNSGLPGLKLVMDSLNRSRDEAANRRMLEDAVDHVAYDEETEEYLQQVSNNQNLSQQVRDFAKQILDDYKGEEFDADTDEEDR
jgi:hypothetical protein